MTLVLPRKKERKKEEVFDTRRFETRATSTEAERIVDNCYHPLRVNTILIMSVKVLLNQSVTLDFTRSERTGHVLMIGIIFSQPVRNAAASTRQSG